MKILFIGTVEFSKKILEKLIRSKTEIIGVCTKKKSKFNNDFANLKPLCKKNKIPIKYVEDVNSENNYNWIKSLNPDIIFCFGWSSILKKKLINIPPMGVLGFHPTLLPKNRGRHPLIWSLALGIKKSACTFFFMDEGVDSGKILSQKYFKIFNNDDARTLYDKVVKIAMLQIEEFLPKLKQQNYILINQNNKISNVWRKRTKLDGKIDFRMTSHAIYNLVRSLSKPYPGAYVIYNNKESIVWKVKIIKNYQNNIESGKILEIKNNEILVKTYDGSIKILKHEFKHLPKVGEYF